MDVIKIIKSFLILLFIGYISDRYDLPIDLNDVEFIINKISLLKFWIK